MARRRKKETVRATGMATHRVAERRTSGAALMQSVGGGGSRLAGQTLHCRLAILPTQ